MSAMQRNKGKAFERKIAAVLRAKWPGVEIRRGQQSAGAYESDVYVSDGIGARIWWELTDGAAPNPASKMVQAERDIEASIYTADVRIPVIVWHRKGSRTINATMKLGAVAWLKDGYWPFWGDPLVTMALDDFLAVLG